MKLNFVGQNEGEKSMMSVGTYNLGSGTHVKFPLELKILLRRDTRKDGSIPPLYLYLNALCHHPFLLLHSRLHPNKVTPSSFLIPHVSSTFSFLLTTLLFTL